jgi:hypothetical protein
LQASVNSAGRTFSVGGGNGGRETGIGSKRFSVKNFNYPPFEKPWVVFKTIFKSLNAKFLKCWFTLTG